jgi:hypothetical protein
MVGKLNVLSHMNRIKIPNLDGTIVWWIRLHENLTQE